MQRVLSNIISIYQQGNAPLSEVTVAAAAVRRLVWLSDNVSHLKSSYMQQVIVDYDQIDTHFKSFS